MSSLGLRKGACGKIGARLRRAVIHPVGWSPLRADVAVLALAAALIEDAVAVIEGVEVAVSAEIMGTVILTVGAEWALVVFRYDQHGHPSTQEYTGKAEQWLFLT